MTEEHTTTYPYEHPSIEESVSALHPSEDFDLLEGGSTAPNVISKILKTPLAFILESENTEKGFGIAFKLLLLAIVTFGVFGVVVGMFSWGQQIWMAPLKIIGGLLFSCLICMPSLYIFSCLGGLDSKFITIVGMVFLMMALAGFLLIGFAPLVWLFSASSQSSTIVGGLLIFIWLATVGFCLFRLFRVGSALGMTNTGQLTVWSVIFVLVTLQMTTSLRPIVGTDNDLLQFEEKKGFLTYWGEQLENQSMGENMQLSKN